MVMLAPLVHLMKTQVMNVLLSWGNDLLSSGPKCTLQLLIAPIWIP